MAKKNRGRNQGSIWKRGNRFRALTPPDGKAADSQNRLIPEEQHNPG